MTEIDETLEFTKRGNKKVFTILRFVADEPDTLGMNNYRWFKWRCTCGKEMRYLNLMAMKIMSKTHGDLHVVGAIPDAVE